MDVTPLVERIRDALAGLTPDPIEEKRMFGGVGFMWQGRLLVATHGSDELVVPLGKGAEGGEGLRPMVMGERVSEGWFFVSPAAIATDADLDTQLRRSMAYLETLPPTLELFAMTVSLCVLLWARPGLAEELTAYEDRVLALVGDHGGEVLQRARTLDRDSELTEIQFIRFASQAGVESYLADPRRTELAEERDRVVARTETMPVEF